jgi:hypothetical protein
MKKKIVLQSVLILLLSLTAHQITAQTRLSVSGGYITDQGDFYNPNGFTTPDGCTIDANIRFNSRKKFQWGGSIGYHSLFANEETKVLSSSFYITRVESVSNYKSLMIGFDYFLSQKTQVKPYIGLDAGIYFLNFTNSVYSSDRSFLNTTRYAVTPNAGIMYDFTQKMSVLLNGRLTSLIDNNGGAYFLLNVSAGLSFKMD